MRPIRFIIVLLFAVGSCMGCAPFWIEIAVEPRIPESQAAAPTREERSILLATVSDTAGAFGLKLSDEFGGPEESTRTTDYWSYEMLALYRRADKETAYSRVEIVVKRDKDTDGIVIIIQDRNGDSYEVFTKNLEAALSSALTAALPSRRIGVTRHRVPE